MFDEDFEADAYKDCATDSLYVEFDTLAKCNAKHTAYDRKQEAHDGYND